MAHAYARLFYHFVWATFGRQPVLEGEIERHAYAVIRRRCAEMGCEVHAIGGVPDHLHLLVALPRTLCPADFMEAIKGCSSRALNDAHGSEEWVFRWQGGYGVHSVSQSHLRRVTRYIEHQKEHHQTGALWSAGERCSEE